MSIRTANKTSDSTPDDISFSQKYEFIGLDLKIWIYKAFPATIARDCAHIQVGFKTNKLQGLLKSYSLVWPLLSLAEPQSELSWLNL